MLSPQITGTPVVVVLVVTVNVSWHVSASVSAVAAGPRVVNVSKSNLNQQMSERNYPLFNLKNVSF